MKVLLTGASGFVGSALVPRLEADGHDLRALARNPKRVTADIEVVQGDVISGDGLDRALTGVDAAYYLIHSMEKGSDDFTKLELQSANNFARAARKAKVDRIVYLGGLVPENGEPSKHLSSRLNVEQALLDACPDSVAFRASIVIGAKSRSFRFLVRLIERLPVIALPPWRNFKTQPIDERDLIDALAKALISKEVRGRSLDLVGPDVLTCGAMIEQIADLMLVGRPVVKLGSDGGHVASVIAAAIAGEDPGLITPLMDSLQSDLLPRSLTADQVIDLRLHSFPSAVEHALAEWEASEPLRAR